MTAAVDYANIDMEILGAMSKHADLKGCPSCTAEDVANVLLFLASDESKPITGQIMVCDYGANL
jgi:enoyl-[acyl-carrier-protein] reductase (NADH)